MFEASLTVSAIVFASIVLTCLANLTLSLQVVVRSYSCMAASGMVTTVPAVHASHVLTPCTGARRSAGTSSVTSQLNLSLGNLDGGC